MIYYFPPMTLETEEKIKLLLPRHREVVSFPLEPKKEALSAFLRWHEFVERVANMGNKIEEITVSHTSPDLLKTPRWERNQIPDAILRDGITKIFRSFGVEFFEPPSYVASVRIIPSMGGLIKMGG